MTVNQRVAGSSLAVFFDYQDKRLEGIINFVMKQMHSLNNYRKAI